MLKTLFVSTNVAALANPFEDNNWIGYLAVTAGLILIVKIGLMIDSWRKKKKDEEQSRKKKYLRDTIRTVFPQNVKYYADGFSIPHYEATSGFDIYGSLKKHDHWESEDRICGITADDVNFEYSELCRYGEYSLHPSMSIGVFSIKNSKNSRGKLTVRTRGFGRFAVSAWDTSLIPIDSVSTEKVDFNEKFVVRADSTENAFYCLTPKIIEAIENLYNYFNRQIFISFENNNINVLVMGLNLFQDAKTVKGNSEREKEVVRQLQLINWVVHLF